MYLNGVNAVAFFGEEGYAVPALIGSGFSPEPRMHQGPLSLVSDKSNMTVSKVNGLLTCLPAGSLFPINPETHWLILIRSPRAAEVPVILHSVSHENKLPPQERRTC